MRLEPRPPVLRRAALALTILVGASVVMSCATSDERRVTTAPDMLEARAYIEVEHDAVWERFTRAEAYADWYSAPCRTFPDAPGGEIVWAVGDRVVYRGELVELRPGEGLVHTFRFEGFGFDEPPTPVHISIVEQGEVVLVTIRHDCSGAPQTAAMISPVGWLKSLSRLKTLLETGTPMTWPDDGS